MGSTKPCRLLPTGSRWWPPRTEAQSTFIRYIHQSQSVHPRTRVGLFSKYLFIWGDLQALNNGLLVDPHDQAGIADALLNLLVDRSMWHECRRNGWKNAHLFSWPEHCRSYLTRVAACRMRHPQWQPDTPLDDVVADESLGDSLKDVHESFLRLSADGDKTSLNGSPEKDPQEPAAAPELDDQVNKILSQIRRPSFYVDSQPVPTPNAAGLSKYPLLRRRRRLFVVALDCYDDCGRPEKTMVQAIQEVFRAVRLDSQLARISGFALSTAMPISETLELLRSGRILPTEFDAIICGSGSEVFYPGTHRCNEEDGKLCPDSDYASHIEYRWDYDGVRRTLAKLMRAKNGEKDGGESQSRSRANESIQEDPKSCSPYCVSFLIQNPSRVGLPHEGFLFSDKILFFSINFPWIHEKKLVLGAGVRRGEWTT